MTIYATSGERVTCENGHHICTFVDTVRVGERQAAELMVDWQQSEPPLGAEIPNCRQCGAPFYVAGGIFHFGEGLTSAWRVINNGVVINTAARPLPPAWDA